MAFPPEIEMERKGQTPEDFMDEDFVTYWKYYIVDGKTDKTNEGDVIDCSTYINNYNENVNKLN